MNSKKTTKQNEKNAKGDPDRSVGTVFESASSQNENRKCNPNKNSPKLQSNKINTLGLDQKMVNTPFKRTTNRR